MSDLISVDATDPNFGIQLGPQVLQTHGPDACAGPNCCIHNPSDHHMVTWRQNWRADRGLMERMCRHGVGHPDPDDIAYKIATRGAHAARHEGVHGCDGCCATPEATKETTDHA